jgi:hypothetical protein
MSSKRLQKKTYVLLASMVFFSSFGNVLLSRGMKQIGEIIDFSPAALASTFLKTFANGSIWLGILSLLVLIVLGGLQLRSACVRNRIRTGRRAGLLCAR